MAAEQEKLRGMRAAAHPIDDWFVDRDYEELYEELFSRAEQSIGAQLRPVKNDKDDGDDR